MRYKHYLCVWLLWATPCSAITLNNTSTAESSPPTSTTISYAHTVHASSNMAVVLVCERDTNGSGFTDDAVVSVGGASALLIDRAQSTDNLVRALLFARVNPSTGSATIAVTGDTGSDRLVVGVLDYADVASSGSFGAPVINGSSGSNNVDVDGVPSSIGELGVMGGCARTSAVTVSADPTAPVSTERLNAAHTDSVSIRLFAYDEPGASGTINMRADLSVSERWAAVGVSMRSASTFRRKPMVVIP